MPARLPYTGNDAADAFLSDDPLALLIGFALDQQVTVQKAFSGQGRGALRRDRAALRQRRLEGLARGEGWP